MSEGNTAESKRTAEVVGRRRDASATWPYLDPLHHRCERNWISPQDQSQAQYDRNCAVGRLHNDVELWDSLFHYMAVPWDIEHRSASQLAPMERTRLRDNATGVKEMNELPDVLDELLNSTALGWRY
jgi:hypothetical protein